MRDAGLDCHVMVAPVLPYLTDSAEHLDSLLGQIAAAGATGVTVFALHLRSSTRGVFMSWLARSHPELVTPYRQLYRRGATCPPTTGTCCGSGPHRWWPSTSWPATADCSPPHLRHRNPSRSRSRSRRCSKCLGCTVIQ